MTGEIRVGITSFGSYEGMVKNMREEFDTRSNTTSRYKNIESEFVFFKKGTKQVMGNAYREEITYDEHKNPKFADAVVFSRNLQFGTSEKGNQPNKFDYIVDTKNKTFALDLNGNNIVDEGEIFSGEIDLHAYREAKEAGDLNRYQEYLEKYTYSWLKNK